MALTDGDADGEATTDGELLAVALTDGEAEGGAAGDVELLAVALTDGDADGEAITDGELLAVALSDAATDGEAITDGELVAMALTDGDADDESITDGELLAVALTDGVTDGEAIGVAEAAGVPVATGDAELLAGKLFDGETLADGITDEEMLYDGISDGELLAVALAADSVPLGDTEVLGLLDGVAAPVAEPLGVAVTVTDTHASGTLRKRLLPVSATVSEFCEKATPLMALKVAAVPTPLMAPAELFCPATTKKDDTAVGVDRTRPKRKLLLALLYKMPADASKASPLPPFAASVVTVYGAASVITRMALLPLSAM